MSVNASRKAVIEGMTVSTSIGTDDSLTTITQSVNGSKTAAIPKNYFITSKGLLKLNDGTGT